MNGQVRSVARALDLLELLARVPEPLGLSELARRLDIPKSTALLLLSTLAARGYVARTEDNLYRLQASSDGHWASGSIARLQAVAGTAMADLVARCGETAYLGVLTADWHVQYLQKLVSPQDVRYDSDITEPRVPYNISTGRVLLAYQPPAMVEEYLTRAVRQPGARRVIGTVRGFLRDLARVRDVGYAVSSGARIAGASGVAAPVFGPGGNVVAALNVTAPTARFPAVRAIMQDSVVAAAARMSRSLAIPTPGARGNGNSGVNRAKPSEAKSVRGGRNG